MANSSGKEIKRDGEPGNPAYVLAMDKGDSKDGKELAKKGDKLKSREGDTKAGGDDNGEENDGKDAQNGQENKGKSNASKSSIKKSGGGSKGAGKGKGKSTKEGDDKDDDVDVTKDNDDMDKNDAEIVDDDAVEKEDGADEAAEKEEQNAKIMGDTEIEEEAEIEGGDEDALDEMLEKEDQKAEEEGDDIEVDEGKGTKRKAGGTKGGAKKKAPKEGVVLPVLCTGFADQCIQGKQHACDSVVG